MVDEDKATQAVAQALRHPLPQDRPAQARRAAHHPHPLAPLRAQARGAPAGAARTATLALRRHQPLRPRALREPARADRRRGAAGALASPSDIHRAIAEVYGFRQQISAGAGAARGRRGRRRREPRAVRQPHRHRRAGGLLRAGHRRGRVPAPLRLRAAGQRHPHRAAAGGVDHPHADRRRAPPHPPHPQGRARRHRQPLQDHEPAGHRPAAAAGRAHPHRPRRRRDGAARLHRPHHLRRQGGDPGPRPQRAGARPLRAGLPARGARRLRALAAAAARAGGGDRPDRQRQDHHPLLGAPGAHLARGERGHHRGPHRDGARGLQPDRRPTPRPAPASPTRCATCCGRTRT